METQQDKPEKVIEYNPVEAGLLRLKEELKEIPDATTADGYKKIKSTLKSGRDLKSLLVATHKTTKADALAFCKKVDGEKNRILSALEETIAPHKAAKDAEDERKLRIEQEEADKAAARLLFIQKRIDGFKEILYKTTGKPSKEIQTMLTALKSQEINEDLYGDFQAEAHSHKSAVMGKLEILLESTIKTEETEERIKKQEEELEEMREKTRIEDEEREEERQKQIDADNKKRDEENARLKEENDKIRADLKYSQDKQREAQKKIDDENKRIAAVKKQQEEEADRIAQEKETARLKVIEEKEAEIERQEKIRQDKIDAEEKEKQEEEEKRLREEAEALADKEAEERGMCLHKAICMILTTDRQESVSKLIEKIVDGEVPYLKIDWTQV